MLALTRLTSPSVLSSVFYFIDPQMQEAARQTWQRVMQEVAVVILWCSESDLSLNLTQGGAAELGLEGTNELRRERLVFTCL